MWYIDVERCLMRQYPVISRRRGGYCFFLIFRCVLIAQLHVTLVRVQPTIILPNRFKFSLDMASHSKVRSLHYRITNLRWNIFKMNRKKRYRFMFLLFWAVWFVAHPLLLSNNNNNKTHFACAISTIILLATIHFWFCSFQKFRYTQPHKDTRASHTNRVWMQTMSH